MSLADIVRQNMNEERFWLLVSLKLSGEAKPDELQELETLLQKHPEMSLHTEMLDTIWQSPSTNHKENKEVSFNKHMQRLSNYFSEPVLKYGDEEAAVEIVDTKPGKVRSMKRTIAWVSSIAASVLLGWFIFSSFPAGDAQKKENVAQNTVSTKRGSKSKIQLPDGTQVWLNADSKITYNENFQGALREVQLTGEAFFDVVRDEKRPFVIHTNAIDVKVLGTSFNVRSYTNEKNTETSLIHGSVEVTLRNNPETKIVLKPSEKLIVQNDNMQVISKKPEEVKAAELKQPTMVKSKISFEKKDSSVIETLWVKNKLAFDREPLEEVAMKIERWFDVGVCITDEKLKKTPFSGVFDDENLPVVMEALRLAGKFRYNINKKEVTIGR